MACCSMRPSCQSSTLLSRRTPVLQRLCQTRQSCCLSQVSGQLTRWLIINDRHISQMGCRFCWHYAALHSLLIRESQPANAAEGNLVLRNLVFDNTAAFLRRKCSVTPDCYTAASYKCQPHHLLYVANVSVMQVIHCSAHILYRRPKCG